MNPLDLLAIALLVIAIILGTRSGALPQIGGLVGAAAGAIAGLTLIPIVLPHLDSVAAPLRIGAVLVVLLLAVGVGEMAGARGGRVLSTALGTGILGILDRVGGAIVGAGQAVLIVWLTGGILATGLIPPMTQAAQTSVAVRGVDLFLPPPTEIVLQLGKVLDRSGLPDVFLGLERLPAEPVSLPSDAVAAAIGRAALASVPRVESDACDYRSTGTGIAVRPGYVVTNAHVIAGARDTRIVTTLGAYPATVVFMDPELDVALLYVPGFRATPLRFATADPGRGDAGATIGYPNGGGSVVAPAAVTDSYQAIGLDIEGTRRVERQIVELEATVDPGDSGGPFLLRDGTVAGVVFAESKTNQSVGYALSPTAVATDIAPALTRTAPVATGPCLH